MMALARPRKRGRPPHLPTPNSPMSARLAQVAATAWMKRNWAGPSRWTASPGMVIPTSLWSRKPLPTVTSRPIPTASPIGPEQLRRIKKPRLKAGVLHCTAARTVRQDSDAAVFSRFDILHGQLDPAAVVHVQYQYLHFLTFLQYVGNLLDTLIGDLRDVYQAVLAGQDADEGTEINDTLDLASVDLADFRFSSNTVNPCLGSIGGIFAGSEDLHGTVIGDVDGSAGFFADTADGCATLADHVTDLVGIDLHADHGRRVGGQFLARGRQHLVHLTEDIQTSIVSLVQSQFHDLFGDALDLDVHLQRGNTLLGTGNLEVHVAQVIFVTQDVGQDGKLVAFLDQTHGDTGNRRLQRHTGIHQRQGRTTDRSHGAGTVGFSDFRDHTDAVGELIHIGHDRLDTTAGQTTVADFTAAGATHATTLTYRIGREVVVEHEGVFLLAFQGIQQLRVTGGTQRGHDQRLGFATGEQRGAVGAIQHADFDVQRAHGLGVATVDARIAVDDALTHGAVFDLTESVLHF